MESILPGVIPLNWHKYLQQDFTEKFILQGAENSKTVRYAIFLDIFCPLNVDMKKVFTCQYVHASLM